MVFSDIFKEITDNQSNSVNWVLAEGSSRNAVISYGAMQAGEVYEKVIFGRNSGTKIDIYKMLDHVLNGGAKEGELTLRIYSLIDAGDQVDLNLAFASIEGRPYLAGPAVRLIPNDWVEVTIAFSSFAPHKVMQAEIMLMEINTNCDDGVIFIQSIS